MQLTIIYGQGKYVTTYYVLDTIMRKHRFYVEIITDITTRNSERKDT
jgi:hypothetical protein